jgi:hypothetical protein
VASWFKEWTTDSFRLTAEWPGEGEDARTGPLVFIEMLDGAIQPKDLSTLEDCISEVLRGEFTNPVAG